MYILEKKLRGKLLKNAFICGMFMCSKNNLKEFKKQSTILWKEGNDRKSNMFTNHDMVEVLFWTADGDCSSVILMYGFINNKKKLAFQNTLFDRFSLKRLSLNHYKLYFYVSTFLKLWLRLFKTVIVNVKWFHLHMWQHTFLV